MTPIRGNPNIDLKILDSFTSPAGKTYDCTILAVSDENSRMKGRVEEMRANFPINNGLGQEIRRMLLLGLVFEENKVEVERMV